MLEIHTRETEAASPQQMTDTVEAIRPPKTKGSFRRGPQGQFVMRACALWVIERLAATGITFEQWFAAGCNLAAIGVNRANAIAQLQAAIPDAHRWYNESGYGKQYATWEAYFLGFAVQPHLLLLPQACGRQGCRRGRRMAGDDSGRRVDCGSKEQEGAA